MEMAIKLNELTDTRQNLESRNSRRILNKLTGIDLSEGEAFEVLAAIQAHKWFVSERLGRDVGMRVAAIDYFENVHDAGTGAVSGPTVWLRLTNLLRTSARLYLTHLSWKANDGIFSSYYSGSFPID